MDSPTTALPISDEQYLRLFWMPAIYDWCEENDIEVPRITLAFETMGRVAVFPDAASAAAFKLRWL